MPTLVLCDDYYHPAHTPRTGLAWLEDGGWEFDWVEHADSWSPERLWAYEAVILTKMNNVSATDQRPWVTEEVASFPELCSPGIRLTGHPFRSSQL